MHSLRWRKVWGDVSLHRARTALVVLAIAIGIMGAGSVLDAWSLLRRVTVDGYLATNPPSATLYLDSVSAPLLAAVRAHPAVRSADARRRTVASVNAGGEWRTAILFSAPDLARHDVGRVVRDTGSWPPGDGALVAEHSSVEFAHLRLGDTITLRREGGPELRLGVTGIARDGSLAPGWMEHVLYAFVSPATLASLGAPSAPNELRIVSRDNATDRESNRAVAAQLRALCERMGQRVLEVSVPVPGRHEHAAQMDSLLFTQGAFGLLLLLLSGFLVVNLVSGMLAGQVRELGIMKAIGASSAQLTTMYLGLALGLGLVACVVAIPAAALIGREYADFSSSILNFALGDTPIPRWAFAVQIVIGALLPVAAALVPVRRASRLSVADALRDTGITDDRPGAGGGLLLGASGLARPLLLSIRNAFRRRERLLLTLLTLTTGGAVFLGAVNLRASIRGAVDNLYGRVLKMDLSLRFEQREDDERVRAIASAVDGVELAEGWSGARAGLLADDSLPRPTMAITALPAASGLTAYPVLEGRWLDDNDSTGLVVNRPLVVEEPAYGLGKTVTLVVNGTPRAWTVRGIVESGPGPAAFASRAAVERATGQAGVSSVVVRATSRSAAAQSELIQRLRDAFEAAGVPVASSILVQAGRAALEDHLLMVASFLGLMSQLMIIVGGLGLASTMSLGVLERTREIGVLRAIGARHGAILAMIQVEGLVVSLLGWALAIPLSLPMSVVLAKAFARVMFAVPVTWVPEASGVLAWLALVVVVSVLACLWPAVRAMRVTTAAALAYE